jgi:hypothetical protein
MTQAQWGACLLCLAPSHINALKDSIKMFGDSDDSKSLPSSGFCSKLKYAQSRYSRPANSFKRYVFPTCRAPWSKRGLRSSWEI